MRRRRHALAHEHAGTGSRLEHVIDTLNLKR